MKPKRRVRLSVLALRTRNLLFYVLSGIVFILVSIYLFALNHMAFRGYVLQQEIETSQDLLDSIAQIEHKITNLQTQENLDKQIKQYRFVPKQSQKFVIIRENFTAQK